MTTTTDTVVIHGISNIDEIPGIENVISNDISIYCAPDLESLRQTLPEANILLGWNFQADQLEDAWDCADNLRWIQWGGAGVDAVLFPSLIESDVQLTNMHGVFDQAIAEYVLGMVLAFAKDLPGTWDAQKQKLWNYRLTEHIQYSQALIVGVGGIGRAIGKTLKAVGCRVQGIGRASRLTDDVFSQIYSSADLTEMLPEADYVVVAAPLTKETRNMFGPEQFTAMKRSARFINIGRGAIVDESSLIHALQTNEISGAALDVFENEPLPQESLLWDCQNVIISPHMAGDYNTYKIDMLQVFVKNLERFQSGKPLLNLVDKRLGFVRSTS